MDDPKPTVIDMTADIVAAYVGANALTAADLPGLIRSVHDALKSTAAGPTVAPTAPPTPAVPVRKSVTPDFLICLEDGRKFKSLRRHLRTRYEMTPDDYRMKWGLPKDYPMVAPNYAAARSALAKSSGLGQSRAAAKRGKTKLAAS